MFCLEWWHDSEQQIALFSAFVQISFCFELLKISSAAKLTFKRQASINWWVAQPNHKIDDNFFILQLRWEIWNHNGQKMDSHIICLNFLKNCFTLQRAEWFFPWIWQHITCLRHNKLISENLQKLNHIISRKKFIDICNGNDCMFVSLRCKRNYVILFTQANGCWRVWSKKFSFHSPSRQARISLCKEMSAKMEFLSHISDLLRLRVVKIDAIMPSLHDSFFFSCVAQQ